MNEQTGSNRGPEIRRRVFRSNRWTGPSRAASASADALPKAAVEAFAERDGEVPRFVVHLPVVTADLAGATNLACALVRSLAFLPEIDGGETTVSEENDQRVRHRVFCDRLLPDRRRCALRHTHAGRCRPVPPPPDDPPTTAP